jgi:hypothetical protein
MPSQPAASDCARGRSIYLAYESDHPHGATAVEEPDWRERRRAAPLNDLLNPTLRWSATLPMAIRPFALMNQFPRLANLIAASWKEPLAFRACLEDLLTDRRGGRQGLPLDVKEELENLRRYYYFREVPRPPARPQPATTTAD